MKCIRLFGGRLKINIILIFAVAAMAVLGMWDTLLYFVPALLLHEGTHILAAGACGIIIEDMELLPFGCSAKVKSFTGLPPVKEIFVAAAGPAANMVAAAGVYFFDKYCVPISWAKPLIAANLMLAAINLLPALPLDGGRILRAVLSKYVGNKRATKASAWMGVVFSVIIAALCVYFAVGGYFNYSMLLMAAFLLYAAIKEIKSAPYTLIRDITGKKELIETRHAVHVRAFASMGSERLRDVLRELDAGRYNLIYVLDRDMKVEYELSEADILDGILKHGMDVSLRSIARDKKKFDA
jgi:stage IV sporulation protein FB